MTGASRGCLRVVAERANECLVLALRWSGLDYTVIHRYNKRRPTSTTCCRALRSLNTKSKREDSAQIDLLSRKQRPGHPAS